MRFLLLVIAILACASCVAVRPVAVDDRVAADLRVIAASLKDDRPAGKAPRASPTAANQWLPDRDDHRYLFFTKGAWNGMLIWGASTTTTKDNRLLRLDREDGQLAVLDPEQGWKPVAGLPKQRDPFYDVIYQDENSANPWGGVDVRVGRGGDAPAEPKPVTVIEIRDRINGEVYRSEGFGPFKLMGDAGVH